MLPRLGRLAPRNAQSALFQNPKRYASTGLLDDLRYRGFIQDTTRPEALHSALEARPQVVYAGVDPTARSLHIGHLLPLMCLFHFQLRGHKIIPLIGGATGLIGDPSGRLSERQPAIVGQIQSNVVGLTASIENFFRRASSYADARVGATATRLDPSVTSNLDWHQSFTMLDFLREVGIHARVNTMLNRESVRARLSSQQGISFTEFTYQLLQAYDFYHLYKNFGCTIQIGGSDQWGNIVAGLEMIGRLAQNPPGPPEPTSKLEAFGITTPLLTTSTGEKFGKSAGNAVWLDPDMTTVFDFYQYFLKVADADVEKYLKLFTLLSQTEISSTMTTHTQQPEKRAAQRRLAAEVTELVHTSSGVARAETMTDLLFGSNYTTLQADDVLAAFENDSRLVLVEHDELFQTPLVKLASKYGLVASTSAARKLIQSRGLYLNNTLIPELHLSLSASDMIDKRLAILRAGKDKLLILASRAGAPN